MLFPKQGKGTEQGVHRLIYDKIYFPWRVLADFLNEAENKIILHQSSLL